MKLRSPAASWAMAAALGVCPASRDEAESGSVVPARVVTAGRRFAWSAALVGAQLLVTEAGTLAA